MSISYSNIKEIVHKVVPKQLVSILNKFLKSHEIKLWDKKKNKTFRKVSLYLALYKYGLDIGYISLKSSIKAWYSANHNSLAKNCQRIVSLLELWGKNQLIMGTLSDWNMLVKEGSLPKSIEKVNLWID